MAAGCIIIMLAGTLGPLTANGGAYSRASDPPKLDSDNQISRRRTPAEQVGRGHQGIPTLLAIMVFVLLSLVVAYTLYPKEEH